MRLTLVATSVLLLAGCVSGFERNVAESRTYRLSAPAIEGGTALPAELLVLRPAVTPGLRTERIASLWPGQRLDYYAGAQWSGELGALIMVTTVEAFAGSGRLRAVEGDPGRFLASHVLGLEVRRFEADHSAGPQPVARVTLAAMVGRHMQRRALASWVASHEVPASANTLGGITAALDEAFGLALRDIVARTHEVIAEDGEAQAAP